MGIPKLYEHIGRGERVSLAALAARHFEKFGRRLRLAVDASIWLFQVKTSLGGVNPELRTIYFRLLRLLRLGIDPVFVFDGKGRPSWKRKKQVAVQWESHRAVQARQMLDLFGMVYHHAPGEAEAECAFLQLEGVVDVVLSEDSDTLMFGASSTIRNWSSNERRGSKEPTHVDHYKASAIRREKGISREGMVLVALMSGADYDPVGIKGCGATIAYEAAKARFGEELFKIYARDPGGLSDWRENLKYEMRTNQSGFFGKRYRQVADSIDGNFPNKAIMDSYFAPLNSSFDRHTVSFLKERLKYSRKVNIVELRAFLGEKLGWSSRGGALKYIRGLAPAIMTTVLLAAPHEQRLEEQPGLLRVCGEREHAANDGMPELKIEIRPIDLVPIDLDAEPVVVQPANTPVTICLISDDESMEDASEKAVDSVASTIKTRQRRPFDPSAPLSLHTARVYVNHRALSKIEAYEHEKQLPKPKSPRKPRTKDVLKGTGMKKGALNGYFNVSKSFGSSQGADMHRLVDAKSSLESSLSVPGSVSAPVSMTTKKQKKVASEKVTVPSSVTPWTKAKGATTDTCVYQASQFKVPRAVSQLTNTEAATLIAHPTTGRTEQQLPMQTADSSESTRRGESNVMVGNCGSDLPQSQTSFTWSSSQDSDMILLLEEPQKAGMPSNAAPATVIQHYPVARARNHPMRLNGEAVDRFGRGKGREIEVIDLSQDVT